MGLYEGGLMATVLYLTVVAFFTVGGVMQQTDNAAMTLLGCVPDTNSVLAESGGLTTVQIGNNCVNSTANITGISSSESQRPSTFAILNELFVGSSSSPSGVDTLSLVFYYITNIFSGWIKILTIILGAGNPMIFLIGIPLQMLQLIFLLQFTLFVLAFFKNGLSVNA